MYQQFTDRSRKVMQLANQESQRFNHDYIGTEHILLGLIKEGAGVAACALAIFDINLTNVRSEVEKAAHPAPPTEPVIVGKLPHTPRARQIIASALQEAEALGHSYVGTEHLLLGLVGTEECYAAKLLVACGATLADVRAAVLDLLRSRPTAEDSVPSLVKLQGFKTYVHGRLDAAGVTFDPESPHKAEGCRIGGRLDELIGERDRLRQEVARLQSVSERITSGFRSHLGDLIRRIGPARRPEDIKATLEDIFNAYNSWADKSAEAERDKLREFIRYWSYCTFNGMRKWCPEKESDLLEVSRELGVPPYAGEPVSSGSETIVP